MPRVTAKTAKRTLDARRDTIDFRDQLYVPTLAEVGVTKPVEAYLELAIPVLDQGTEGACTGFGLATVANCLLTLRRNESDRTPVSPRMLYEMARRYDEWPGTDYSGSSCRGAMKGWHKHGVCTEAAWQYQSTARDNRLTIERAQDAVGRPLGAYFRVNHKDIVAMHTAITEANVLYASASVHAGWFSPPRNGRIDFQQEIAGGHAFAIVAYDRQGFWIQNSWGADWGRSGLGHITYDEWLVNGTDCWVARLGVPLQLGSARAVAENSSVALSASQSYSVLELTPHIIVSDRRGQPELTGTFGKSATGISEIFSTNFAQATASWTKKRILLYSHGALVPQEAVIQRVADYRKALLVHEIYPVGLVWPGDLIATLDGLLHKALGLRSSELPIGGIWDGFLDRMDETLEPVARSIGGNKIWEEMKENARQSCLRGGAAGIAAKAINALMQQDKEVELHLVSHSTGSIAFGQFTDTWFSLPQAKPLSSLTFWAPAITIEDFKQSYLPWIKKAKTGRTTLFTLTDEAEQDDNCVGIYHKSLLYLVSHAFETIPRDPSHQEGTALLGLARDVDQDKDLAALLKAKKLDWIQSPNNDAKGSPSRAKAVHHGSFNVDPDTVWSTLLRILRPAAPSAAAARQTKPLNFAPRHTRQAQQNQVPALVARLKSLK